MKTGFYEHSKFLFNIKHTKPYVIIFNLFNDDEIPRVIESKSITEYDTISDVQDELDLLHTMYKTELANNTAGYIVLDYKDSRIRKFGGDGVYLNNELHLNKDKFKNSNKLMIIDKLFRGKDEVPVGYTWDNGEYDGWLQYRWGDGKNAVIKD